MTMLESTQIQFGGFIINSDDDAAIIHHITRLIASAADALEYVVQICHLLFVLIPLLIEVCHRLLGFMDALDATWQAVIEAMDLRPKFGYAPG